MKYYYGVVHGIVKCRDCGWTTESYKNCQALAKKHAMKYGHTVEGELGIAFGYGENFESAPNSTKGQKR